MSVQIDGSVAETLQNLAQARIASVNEAINQLTHQRNEIDARINQLREEVVVGVDALEALSDALMPF